MEAPVAFEPYDSPARSGTGQLAGGRMDSPGVATRMARFANMAKLAS